VPRENSPAFSRSAQMSRRSSFRKQSSQFLCGQTSCHCDERRRFKLREISGISYEQVTAGTFNAVVFVALNWRVEQ